MALKKVIKLSVPLVLAAYAGISAAQEPSAQSQQASPQESSNLNTQAPRASERLLMDIKRIINNRLVAVGERGHILISDDQGETWRQILVPTETLLTKLFFVDDKTGWAIGHDQTILKTENAGEEWRIQYESDNLDQPALFDIWFSDKNNGIAVGAYGLYLKTNDGGDSWEDVYQESLENEEIGFPHFYSIVQDGAAGRLYIAGELGFLAFSEDNGDTWQMAESPYDGSFFNAMVTPDNALLLMGLRGHLFRSSDQGETWSEVETGTISGLQESVILDDKRLLIVGSDGTQLISDDYGKTVQLIQRSDRIHLAHALSLLDGQIMLVGIQGAIKTQLK
ncbi:hypothetical protein FLL45_01105 [Aliikangiella marina]|uniref:Photosynthesis system II assembly factor Ycf48/Hcf136-like domain-containing protein n=1 Tax=Aliikangiella marina TaxID=1712262 RepID=A0A545TH99_9GAMM|nr:YCF48-related protein [Aliikangiella marina]TQV76585.1 hypothetical protein FLL45_01105 [Aliikangiella marina]